MGINRFATSLSSILGTTAALADQVSSDSVWRPETGSPGHAELANTEMGPQSQWGEGPVRTAYAVAAMAVQAIAEYAKAMQPLVMLQQSPLVPETLARGALEAAASAWWLLEEGLGARRRVCRLQLVRIKSALELQKALREVGISNADDRYGETPDEVKEFSSKLGLGAFLDKGHDIAAACETEVRPGYTERVKSLLTDWKFTGAYNIYSGSAHAELYAVWRLFRNMGPAASGQEPIFRLAPDRGGLQSAVHGVLLAVIAPLERAALLFGWHGDAGPGAQISKTIDLINEEMAEVSATV